MEHTIKTLPSGARLLFVTDSNSPSVEITLFIKVGSRTDPIGKQGITHLIEHLNFQGTSIRKHNKEIVLEIENLGGQIDAFTGYESMGFSIKCPSKNVLQSMDIIFDLVLNSKYADDEILREKKVIIEEIKMYEDIPSEKARDTFQENMFGGNNLGFNIAGTIKTLEPITRKDILNHVKGIICQENLLISVAGDFDEKSIEKKIVKILEKVSIERSIEPIAYSRQKVTNNPSIINIKRDIAQSNLVIGTYGSKRSIKKDYALRLGNIILSGGMGSLLYQRIREELRLAYYVNSTHSEFNDIGLFQIEMGVDDNKIEEAVGEVIDVLKSFGEGKFGTDDFIRAKNFLLGVLVTQIETSSDLASWNAYNLMHRKGQVFESKQQIINDVEMVTPKAVKETWQTILRSLDFLYVNVGKKELIL